MGGLFRRKLRQHQAECRDQFRLGEESRFVAHGNLRFGGFMSRESIRSVLHVPPLLGALLLYGCGELSSPTGSIPAPSAQQPTFFSTATEFYGYEQADEITTASDGTELTDESLAASCPHFDGITRPLKLGVKVREPNGEDHIASFVFEGFKPFVAYESRGAKPVALFGPVPETLSEGNARYVARGFLRVRCEGRYYRIPGGRIWSGKYLTLSIEHVEDSGLYSPPGECDYMYVDTTNPCPGGGGSGGGSSGGGEGGGGGVDLCVYLNLDPGCYDVYVDGEYDGSICC